MIKAAWPALVSRETFTQVQERLTLNQNRYKPEEWKTYPFPLTELVICGECGRHMGGKSGTGRKGKHYYYSHPQPKDPTKRISELDCQVKSVRAPRLEELVMKCLKSVLNDPALITKWVSIYREQTPKQKPEVHAEAKRLDGEISALSRKISNLVNRIADLPSDVPADSFYEQIKQLTEKKRHLVQAKERLAVKIHQMNDQEISEEGLFFRLKAAVEKLERLPKEQQRPVLKEIFHSIEIKPLKLKIGFYAPKKPSPGESGDLAPETKKATGTDGLALNQILKSEPATLIPFDPTRRVGSTTVGIGAPGRT